MPSRVTDRLTEIETWVYNGNFADGDDVLALVEIAKAAREAVESAKAERLDVLWSNGQLWIEELDAALSVLDDREET